MKISKELLKGSTATMILKIISEGDTYGYEIAAALETRSDGVFTLKEGTMYPILHMLEKEGYVEAYRKLAETGRERRYYRITAAGRAYLALRLEEWQLFSDSFRRVVEGGK